MKHKMLFLALSIAIMVKVVFASEVTVKYGLRNKVFDYHQSLASAGEIVQGLVKEYPDNWKFHYIYGVYLMGVDDSMAKREFEKVLELKPDHSLSHFHLGLYDLKEKNYPDAIKRYSSAIRYDDKYAIYYNSLALVYLYAGDEEKALRAMESGLSHIDDDTLSFNYALLLLKYRPQDKAKILASLEKAERLKPDDYDYHFALGAMYLENKNYLAARSQYEKAIKIKPDDLISNLAIVTTYCQTGDQVTGKKLLWSLKNKYPGEELIKQEMEECESVKQSQ